MRIAIATVQVPFVKGGAEILTNMLKDELIKRGHQAEIISIPFRWWPYTTLIDEMHMGRSVDLSGKDGVIPDLVIAMKFPIYYLKHDNKVLWLMHQHRQAYDQWDTEYSDIQQWDNGEEVRDFIRDCDNKYLSEYSKRFTIAENTSNRLMKFNNIDSKVLYHPPLNYELLHCESYGDYIFYPSRINTIKRQMLLVEAARYVKTDAKVIIAGAGSDSDVNNVKDKIKEYSLEDKVKYVGLISEEEKISYYANCLGVYFGAYDEDYGYITLEGMFSEKPVIVHKDSGGPLEFITNEENGFVVDVDPKMIAEKIDELYLDRKKAERLGKAAKASLIKKNMNWDYVVNQLLQ